MSYSDSIIKGKYIEAKVDELANVLITLDGLGQEKKRQALIELLNRAMVKDYDVAVWVGDRKIAVWVGDRKREEAQEKA